MPAPEEMIEATPEARRAAQQERHRPGFEDIVWFRMNIGRRQNADPRWILPLICRRGHITKNEVGAIRIQANETAFQVPRALAAKFQAAIQRTAGAGEDDVLIEASPSAPRPQGGPQRGGPNRPQDLRARTTVRVHDDRLAAVGAPDLGGRTRRCFGPGTGANPVNATLSASARATGTRFCILLSPRIATDQLMTDGQGCRTEFCST